MWRPAVLGRSTRTAPSAESPGDHESVPSLGNGITRPIPPFEYSRWLGTLDAVTPLESHPEFLTDWMGVRTRMAMLPWAPQEFVGTVSSRHPIPDDGYRSEDFEYVALARAIAARTTPFQMIEIGAGWAPWSVAAIVACRERGRDARAVAVEADQRRVEWAAHHAEDNGINARVVIGDHNSIDAEITEWRADDSHPLLIVCAAAWHSSGELSFPNVPVDDMGAAIWTLPGTDVDYRGAHLEHSPIPAIAMSSLLAGLRDPIVDLLHIDVQGVEFELLATCAHEVQERVLLMAVGTHSRMSEGRLLDFFLPRGWGVIIDSPCRAEYLMTRPTLAGFTVQDGMQLWENPFLTE
jgi:FkbM family methyltransferase